MESVWIFIIIIAAAAVIGTVSFIIYRLMNPKLKNDEKTQKTEQDYVQEELDRILQPVDDAETAKSISDYKEIDD